MTQQSNTPEYFNAIIARIESERDAWRKEAQEYRSLLYGCGNHGLWNGLSCIGCVEAERDQLRKVADELHWLASLADYDSQRRDDALSNYNNLPHIIARKEKK